jgi:3-hydroxyisobutyrate dehydrogenase
MEFKHIGVVGLGQLGGTIAKVLTEDGTVHGCDLDPARCKLAAASGVVIEASPAAVAKASDVVLLSLPESDAVAKVCTGPDGILSSGKRGLLIIDTTSGYPSATLETAAKLKAAGMSMIEATITGLEGGIHGSIKRELTLMVGGEEADVARARPLMERLATHIIYAGPLGTGQIVKMVNNMCSAVAMVATMEGMLVAAKHGISPWAVAEAMRYGTGANLPAQTLEWWHNPSSDENVFSVGLMTKDVRQMSRFARESGVPALMSDTVFHLYELFTAELGYGVNLLRLRDVMEKWAGVKLDVSPVVRQAQDDRTVAKAGT